MQNQLKTLIAKHTASMDLEKPHEVIVKNGKIKVWMIDVLLVVMKKKIADENCLQLLC